MINLINHEQDVDRIIDLFPPYQQEKIRLQVASTLKGVISQILLSRASEPVCKIVSLVADEHFKRLRRVQGGRYTVPRT